MDKQFNCNNMLGSPLTEREKKVLEDLVMENKFKNGLVFNGNMGYKGHLGDDGRKNIEEDNSLNPLLENLDYVNGNVVNFSRKVYEMLELYSRKNRDYGNSFDKSLDEDGLLVSKIRLMDKMNRFSTLIKDTAENRLVSDETIEDTLMDLASYAVMTIMWMEKGRAENEQELHVYSDGVKQDI